jgi:hypothetical protein
MIDIIGILFVAFVTASLTNFIDDCLADGMIFGKYGTWAKDGSKWKKPIGGCMICTNAWVNILTGTAVSIYFTIGAVNAIILTLALVAISNTFLKFIIR